MDNLGSRLMNGPYSVEPLPIESPSKVIHQYATFDRVTMCGKETSRTLGWKLVSASVKVNCRACIKSIKKIERERNAETVRDNQPSPSL